jgi:hypothetical protein
MRLRHLTARLALLALLVGALVGRPFPAEAWGRGFNRVLSATEESSSDTGSGPGWVGLSYQPNGPIIGTLFAKGLAGEPDYDHMDIQTTRGGGHPRVYPGGFAYGNFGGCAWAYTTKKFKIEGTAHTSSCNPPPAHTTGIFCSDHARDYLCNDGKFDPARHGSEAGVMGRGGNPAEPDAAAYPASIKAPSCTAFGNYGAQAFTGSGQSGSLRNPVGTVPGGTPIKVRYVTKDDRVVMAGGAPGLLNGMYWALYSRDCVEYQPGQ